ncbi:hypothetical protein BDZ90DRAFT_263258 [Jaminaea rosea]|uniref:Uncharacterized protein n=1 Tax=Jaminaea rosea TaxID=1569628 RepID=A0A316UGM1_9BASI|nr:hypothetical protein BDZ90DRAFT_263258 [Jaminaea rosea]PWN24412.1 hypothetical protein BDZ90DRAFT_263258 [Jaminaea rosea]
MAPKRSASVLSDTASASAPDSVSLNIVHKNQIDWIEYVDKLPSLPLIASSVAFAASSSEALDLPNRRLVRLIGISAEDRDAIWRKIQRKSGINGKVLGGKLYIELIRYTGVYELSLGHAQGLPDGPASLLFFSNDTTSYASQPAAATAEVSYLLNNYRLVLQSQTTDVSLPCCGSAEIITQDWSRFLSPLGKIASLKRNELIVYADLHPYAHSKLAKIGVRLRDGGCRLRATSSLGGSVIVTVPGDVHNHARLGAITAIEGQLSVQLGINLGTPWREEGWDINLWVCECGDGTFSDVYYRMYRSEDRSRRDKEMFESLKLAGPSWFVCYLINAAYMSRGCSPDLFMAPSDLSVEEEEDQESIAA